MVEVTRYAGIAKEANYGEEPASSITNIDTTNDEITVEGDVTHLFSVDDVIEVRATENDDGQYTVSTINYDSTNDETTIGTSESLDGGTVTSEDHVTRDIDYIDMVSSEIGPPDDQANFLETAGTRGYRYKAPANYIPEGDMVLPITADKFGRYLNGLMGDKRESTRIKTYSIVSVDTTNDTVTVDGDLTSGDDTLESGDTFDITGSTGNDGEYTADTVSYDSGNDETTVTTTESIGDSTADGDVALQPASYSHIWWPEQIELPSYTLYTGKDEFEQIQTGVLFDEMSLETTDNFLEATMSLVGGKDRINEERPAITESRFPQQVVTATNATFIRSGTDVTARIKSFNFTYQNELNQDNEVSFGGRFPTSGARPQRLQPSLEMELEFDSSEELRRFWGDPNATEPQAQLLEDSAEVSFVQDPKDQEFNISLPRNITMSHDGAPVESRDEITQNVTWNSMHDDDAGYETQMELINHEDGSDF